jgi:uncharacterized membrane protein YccC
MLPGLKSIVTALGPVLNTVMRPLPLMWIAQMSIIPARLRTIIRSWAVELRLSCRVTFAALATYALAQALHIPLVLWAVLTAIIVTQLSVGRTLKATIDYFVGTLSGAIFSSLVATLIPHESELGTLAVLAVALAPLALLAAIKPSFTVAPFTAVMVLLVPMLTHISPLESAYYRVIEVALGGVVALAVSFLVFPERAHGLLIESAARLLDLMTAALGELLDGFGQKLEEGSVRRIQDGIGEAVARLGTIESEVQRERLTYIFVEPDLAPLLRTLLRLRHDLVMIGRATMVPLPEIFQVRIGPPLVRFRDTATNYLRQSSIALIRRRAPPPLAAVDGALGDYNAVMAALRSQGLTRALSGDEAEHFFTLGFALEQLHRNFRDLERCVAGNRRAIRSSAKTADETRPSGGSV